MKRGLTFCFLLAIMLFLSGCAQFEPRQNGTVDAEALNSAIDIDDVGYVRSAIESGQVSPNQRIPASSYMEGTPLLTLAARAAALDVMRYLIAAGADINARTPAGETPLMLASFFFEEARNQGDHANTRHEKAVHMLVESGAYLENEPDSYTPLAYAAYQGHDRIVTYLIAHGARPNADAVNGGIYINTPLMMAVIQGHRSTALKLLNAGADARIRVHGGYTAAEFAEKYQHSSLLPMLRCAETLAQQEPFQQRCRAGNIAVR